MTLDERIENARKGRAYWIDLIENYKVKDNDYVVLMPHEDGRYSKWVIKYLSRFIEKKNISKAILLTRDKKIVNKKINNLTISEISEEDSQNLLQFYCLYQFTTNLLIASLDVPAFRIGKGYLNMGKTLEYAFKTLIFDLGE